MVSTDGRTDGRTDTEGYNIIPRHTLVAGYKNTKVELLIVLSINLKYNKFVLKNKTTSKFRPSDGSKIERVYAVARERLLRLLLRL